MAQSPRAKDLEKNPSARAKGSSPIVDRRTIGCVKDIKRVQREGRSPPPKPDRWVGTRFGPSPFSHRKAFPKQAKNLNSISDPAIIATPPSSPSSSNKESPCRLEDCDSSQISIPESSSMRISSSGGSPRKRQPRQPSSRSKLGRSQSESLLSPMSEAISADTTSRNEVMQLQSTISELQEQLEAEKEENRKLTSKCDTIQAKFHDAMKNYQNMCKNVGHVMQVQQMARSITAKMAKRVLEKPQFSIENKDMKTIENDPVLHDEQPKTLKEAAALSLTGAAALFKKKSPSASLEDIEFDIDPLLYHLKVEEVGLGVVQVRIPSGLMPGTPIDVIHGGNHFNLSVPVNMETDILQVMLPKKVSALMSYRSHHFQLQNGYILRSNNKKETRELSRRIKGDNVVADKSSINRICLGRSVPPAIKIMHYRRLRGRAMQPLLATVQENANIDAKFS